jgi:HK97 family phage portal protein
MKLLDRALGVFGYEKRNASDPYWANFMALRGGGVSPKQAESISAVYACVSAISETIASLPLTLYKRDGDEGRVKAKGNPLYTVLHDSPNPTQTSLQFREQQMASVLLTGNSYALIVRDKAGQVVELWPIHPNMVTVNILDNGRPVYDVVDRKGQIKRYLMEEVFHLRHRTDNGYTGISPIAASRETVELAISEREHGSKTFSNGTRLSGLLKAQGTLKPDEIARLRDSWNSQYSGASNAGKVALLESGVEFQALSMTLEDAEWIAARQFSVEEVCRLFRVPPTIIGDLRHGNYSNSVEMGRQFVVLSLRRHMVMWEQQIALSLLSEAGRRQYFAEHNVEGLLRGDSLNRSQFYSNAIGDGWMDREEVRQLENLPKR